MQFALPPRSSHHSVYNRSSAYGVRRRQLKICGILSCLAVAILLFLSYGFSSTETPAPNDGPKVVIVTVLDEERFSDQYIQRIKANREDYVARHGYVNFFASAAEYAPYIGKAPRSWAMVPAMRHAMTLYPGSTYFFHLSPHALIMDPAQPLTSLVLDKKSLDSLMIKGVPVVPPASVIKTFGHLSAKDVDLIVSQDGESLSPGSLIVKKGDWAQYFLDAWFDPLYRSYNFAKAEVHALDHMVQWHPTILARLGLVPQRTINSYSPKAPYPSKNGIYRKGDFLIRFYACDADAKRNCEEEMEPYWKEWVKETDYEG